MNDTSKAIAPINDIGLEIIDSQPMTTSLEVARHFGKRHDDVLKRVRSLNCSSEFNDRNFAGVEYVDPKGGEASSLSHDQRRFHVPGHGVMGLE